MTTYIGIVRDHSASMSNLKKGAAADYNLTIEGIKLSAAEENQETYISVVECGYGHMGSYRVVERGVPVAEIAPITNYSTTGSATPLWDSVAAAIEACKEAARKNRDDDSALTAFLIMVITDGEHNRGEWTAHQIGTEIRRLQATEQWTFAFRVPRGYAGKIIRPLGLHDGNVLEWEQTEHALNTSTQATVGGVQNYFKSRSAGVRHSNTFYASTSNLTKAEVQKTLTEITHGINVSRVGSDKNGIAIREFCVEAFGDYTPGCAYYQLTKSEKVQDRKRVVIRDVNTGKFFSGAAARELLGLPPHGEIRVTPAGSGGQYDIFVQSTSVNRKLVDGTDVVYLTA